MTDVTSPTPTVRNAGLARVARPSGAFAMLAVDQREAMRAMFAEHQTAPVTDQQLTDFKVAATRVLTPYASAVLVDKQFAFDAVVDAKAVAPTCGLIAGPTTSSRATASSSPRSRSTPTSTPPPSATRAPWR